MGINHEDAPIGEIHKFINWEFATATELDEYSNIVAKDFHKVAYVAEVQGYFAPIAVDAGTGEVTWISVGGSGSGGTTNLSTGYTATNVTVLSSTGTDAVIAAANETVAGVMLPAQVTKLAGLNIGTADAELVTNAELDSRLGTTGNLGSAAQADSSAFATAAQGTKADSAIQVADLNTRLGTAGNLGTAAQRNIGTGTSDVPDVAQLNSRIGTTGNLGTMAQQNANAVAITGGSAAGITSLGMAGDINFSLGAGRKLLAPMSYGTLASNFTLQTVATDNNSIPNIAPSGTAQIAGLNLFNSSDLGNSAFLALSCRSTEARIASSIVGSGAAVPLTIHVGTEAARIHTSRNVSIGSTTDNGFKLEVTGTAKATTGINVGNVVSASATVFDWYEEIIFTPVAEGSTTAGVGTYTVQSGNATRKGNTVTFRLAIGWSAHTGTGNLVIAGLPFTSASSGAPVPVIIYSDGLVIGAGKLLSGLISSSQTSIVMRTLDQAGGASALLALDTTVSVLDISGVYFV